MRNIKRRGLFISISISFLLVIPLIINGIDTDMYINDFNKTKSKKNIGIKEICSNDEYLPKNITPKNVSYHESEDKFNIEWWYFEGIFNNGYNAIVNIILFSKKNIGFCMTHLNIFHNNDPNEFFSKRKIQSIKRFQGSDSYPDISINKKQVIKFNQEKYNTSKKWIYNVTFEIEDNAVNLKFLGITSGWEGSTLGGYYGPVLPMADVNGNITINNRIINVTGLGYHEHARGISFPILEWGWYWGKIIGDNTGLFWGKMMNTFFYEQGRAGVFSIKNSSFINIEPDNIKIKLQDYKFNTKRFIPTKFIFNITDAKNKIFVNVTITTINIYYLPIGLFHYWRYLIKINGEISYNNTKEILRNKIQIMELMRFR